MHDQDGVFDVTVLDVEQPSSVVLFAVGGGGNPERHDQLLQTLAERGCSVVAPHFERMVSPTATDHALLLRARRLRVALDAVIHPGVPTAGVGHSIGATMLLALAGGKVWPRPGHPLPIAPEVRLARLALMAPATGFFLAPGALDAVQVPIVAWVGTQDAITPRTQTELLRDTLGERLPVDVRIVEGAGHFSFMNQVPPQIVDPLQDRDAILRKLAAEVADFVAA